MTDTTVVPELSFVIPAYNASKYLHRSINSVLKQTYRNIELVLIDDGSNDNTVSTAKSLLKDADFPFKIHSQPNRGVSAARNKGILLSRGNFVHFLDSDDEIKESFAERMLFLAHSTGSELVVCGQEILREGEETPHRIFNTIAKEGLSYSSVSNTDLASRILCAELLLNAGSFVFKKSYFVDKQLCFTTGCKLGEDREFIIKALLEAKKVCATNEVMFRYVLVPDSASTVATMKRFEDVATYFRLAKFIEVHFPDSDLSDLIRQQVIPSRIIWALLYLDTHGFDREKLVSLVKHPKIRETLRRFAPMCRRDGMKKRIMIRMLLEAPRTVLQIYRIKHRLGI